MIKTLLFDVLRYFNESLKGDLFSGELTQDKRERLIVQHVFPERDFADAGRDYTIRSVTAQDDFISCKLARKEVSRLYEKTEHDIRRKAQDTWPFIWIVCDLKKQMLFVQRNADFPSVGRLSSLMISMSARGYRSDGYVLRIEPIVVEGKFWELVESADRIYALKLTLHSPNFFGATEQANKVLERIHKTFNNTRTKIELDNEDGELSLPKGEIEKYTDYADHGGGNWQLKMESKGSKKTRRSSDHVKRVTVTFKGEMTEEEILELLRKKLNDDAS